VKVTRNLRKLLAWAAPVLAWLVFLVPPAAADTWYAAPGGSTTNDCTASDADHVCSIQRAVTVAAANDEVIAAPGSYDLQATLNVDVPLTLRGQPDQPRPRLVAAPTLSPAVMVTPSVASLRHLAIESRASGGIGLQFFTQSGSTPALIEGVELSASGAGGRAALLSLQGSATSFIFRDSVARTTGAGSAAVVMNRSPHPGPINADADVRNLTLDARGADSLALSVASGPQESGCANLRVIAKNVIAVGTRNDLGVSNYAPTCTAKLETYNSNWRTQETSGGGVVESHNDQFPLPLFAAPASGDYHQLPGSPTIDAGLSSHFDAKLGTVDFDGQPRLVGASTDIGADEYVAAPPAPPGPAPAQEDGLSLAGLDVNPGAFLAARAGPSVRKAQRPRYGGIVFYALSEAARVSFRVERASPGRRVRGRCVRPRRSNRRARRCLRYLPRNGSFSHSCDAGRNRFRFMGRLAGKKLPRGSYRLVARARDAEGDRSRVRRTGFRIRGRKGR
jgi:hypothetical protein